MSYNIRFDSQPRERDRVFQFDGVRVFVDPKSFIYLHGMTLDYEETLMRQGFDFMNPNSHKVLRLRHIFLSLACCGEGHAAFEPCDRPGQTSLSLPRRNSAMAIQSSNRR